MRKTAKILALSSLLVLVSACSGARTGDVVNDGSSSSSLERAMDASSSASSDSNSSVAAMDSSSAPAAGISASVSAGVTVSAPSASARIIEMKASDWEFSPSAITAKKGEKLIVRVTGVEGQHSFAIADLGINVAVAPGEVKDIEIPTDKAGTFEFRCRIPCGPGHKDMMGSLVIS